MSFWRSNSVRFNLGIIALVFGILALVKLPDSSFLWKELHNFGHTPLFGLLALAFLRLLRTYLGDNFLVLVQYLVAGLIALACGVGWELLQIFTPGDADPVDVARDAVGILAFLAIWLAFDRRYWRALGGKRTRQRVNYLLLGMSVLIISMIPLMVWSAAYIERDNDFPTLSQVGSHLGRKFFFAKESAISAVDPPPGWSHSPNHKVLHVVAIPGPEYPGIELADPAPNWQGYSRLSFDLFNPADSTFPLVISISDDRHNLEFNDRYTERLYLTPGLNRIDIDLNQVAQAPVGRTMDMGAIARVELYVVQPHTVTSWYQGDLHLR